MPLAIAVAERAETAKDETQMLKAAHWISAQPHFATRELRIADAAGRILTRGGDPKAAVELFCRLIALPTINDDFRRIFIDHGLKACEAAHDESSAQIFHSAYQGLKKAK